MDELGFPLGVLRGPWGEAWGRSVGGFGGVLNVAFFPSSHIVDAVAALGGVFEVFFGINLVFRWGIRGGLWGLLLGNPVSPREVFGKVSGVVWGVFNTKIKPFCDIAKHRFRW